MLIFISPLALLLLILLLDKFLTMIVFSCIFLTWELIWFAAWDMEAVTDVGKTMELTTFCDSAIDDANVEQDSGAVLLVTW